MGKAAVLVKGISYARDYRCGVNYLNCIKNFKTHIIDPLIRLGWEVDVFIATYLMDGLDKEKMIADYGAKGAIFLPFEGSCQKTTLYKGLESIVETGVGYNNVIVLRFDIELKTPIDRTNIDWGKINFSWRETERYWRLQKRVGDIVTIIPYKFIEVYMKGLLQFSASENIHRIYSGLASLLGDGNECMGEGHIHFICEDGFYDSARDNPLYNIVRGC